VIIILIKSQQKTKVYIWVKYLNLIITQEKPIKHLINLKEIANLYQMKELEY